ncbi:HNH endonuclease family protein [Rothia nasimurium]|uniref:HNH endonuclease family protein n=1 Tax=Rothia nasimurium TaxID=85336 RepID=UPI003B9FD9BA
MSKLKPSRRRSRTLEVPEVSDRQIRAGVRWWGALGKTLRRALTVLLLVVLLCASLFWLGKHQWNPRLAWEAIWDVGQPVSTGFAHSGVETYSTATAVLDSLTVADRSSQAPYARAAFGEPWADIDGNGCDQRNDVLARDLTDIERDSRCRVLTGTLLDPYSAETIDFTRGPDTSEAVPVDHVVALSNAWGSGAWAWGDAQRALIANDPLNLQAAGYLANTEKSDKDAAAWLPQPGYRCEYVARQISVKDAYHLTVTQAEKRAMQGVLGTCPDQPAYRSSFAGE